jgi:hypothetical protein
VESAIQVTGGRQARSQKPEARRKGETRSQKKEARRKIKGQPEAWVATHSARLGGFWILPLPFLLASGFRLLVSPFLLASGFWFLASGF